MRVLLHLVAIANLSLVVLGGMPALADEGTAVIQNDSDAGDLPDGDLSDQDLPDGDLPDQEVPDGDLSGDRDLSDEDLPSGEEPRR